MKPLCQPVMLWEAIQGRAIAWPFKFLPLTMTDHGVINQFMKPQAIQKPPVPLIKHCVLHILTDLMPGLWATTTVTVTEFSVTLLPSLYSMTLKRSEMIQYGARAP